MMENKQSRLGQVASFFKVPRHRLAFFVVLRYALPLLAAFLVLVLGAFYNVSTVQLGKKSYVSVLRLLFNTLKSGREYLLGDKISDGVRTFYMVLIVGAVLLLVFYLISVAVSVFALRTLWRVYAAARQEDLQEIKQAKILFCAFVPNRVWLTVLHFAAIAPALFPELFSLICSRFLTVSGGNVLYVRFNPVLLVAGILLLAAAALGIWLRHRECDLDLDLFDIEGDGSAASDDGDEGDDEGDSDADDGNEEAASEEDEDEALL